MRLFWGALFLFSIGFAEWSEAQVYVQKYQIEKLSFQYRSNKVDESRCLKWFPLKQGIKVPIEYTKSGEPYLTVVLKAKAQRDCPLNFENPPRIKELPSPRQDQRVFEVKVTPPVSVITVEGPDFIDELVLEAPLKEFEDVGFFTYFAKSQVYFDLRYVTLTTDNPSESILVRKVNMAPVLSGFLTIPVPFSEEIFVGLAMTQNLGNFLPKGDVPTQISEVAFDVRYSLTGSEAAGRPNLSFVFDYRAKNIYQTVLDDEQKSFVLTSVALPGFGVDGSYYFGEIDWGKRFGITASSRFYLLGRVSDSNIRGTVYDFGLNFRLDKKWALGFGYAWAGSNVNIPDPDDDTATLNINENQTMYFMRLSLVPFIERRGPK
jgi:hypothetical protein